MSDVVIRTEGLGKRYRLGQQEAAYRTLRESIASLPGRLAGRLAGDGERHIWALRDVNLEIREGEVVGVIGRNGAGKTTLLKVLSRITEPTAGRVLIHGKVGSLLEVGTGFHPELTGRENIYLSGAILGMKKEEINRKFDEIVDFAEVERFLDTPVKRYSSGMYVRLAFAVAAHLDPGILLVDEVLAVGDAAFQKKCLGKMEKVSRRGRTVLFVSHQMPMVRALCERAVLLDGGGLRMDGRPGEVIDAYLTCAGEPAEAHRDLSAHPRSNGDQIAIREGWVEDERGRKTGEVYLGRPFSVCFRFAATRTLRNPGFGFGLETGGGLRVLSLSNYLLSPDEEPPRRDGLVRCRFDECTLLPGRYYVSLSIVESQAAFVDYAERALSFTVLADDVFGTGRMLESSQGVVYGRGEISISPFEEESP